MIHGANDSEKKGHIIFLNGTSSSGKTTCAKALQLHLTEPYMYLSLDNFIFLVSPQYLPPTGAKINELDVHLPHIVSGFHHCIAQLALRGNNVLVDHVLQEQTWLWECVSLLHPLPSLFVKVYCPLPILKQREHKRGDRAIGLAEFQYNKVHAHNIYDMEVDTAFHTVEENVHKIKKYMDENSHTSAFTLLEIQRKQNIHGGNK
jgi:chloramphenicol 3-O phosphotransferase